MWPAAALLCLHHGMNKGIKSRDILYFLFKSHEKTDDPEVDVVRGASLLPWNYDKDTSDAEWHVSALKRTWVGHTTLLP